ncbi:MAG: hypothetical protein JOZ90_13310 [Alphaproteobacteria bacterium]|nr:hypothetical protein [Alphaproteobacteria bacterium]MBV9372862.1 hypothetical protein [Alphaproteobacteria bacterium]MBV9902050.1 hypothetical protein [Alphaproteobacteria bacterium]
MALIIFTVLMGALAARGPLLHLMRVNYVPRAMVSWMILTVTLIIWLRVLGVGACGRGRSPICDDTAWFYIAIVAAVATASLLYGLIRELRGNFGKDRALRHSSK